MFDDDLGDRTLPPTERRRREARQQGDVARSPQLTSALVLFAVSCLFLWLTPASISPLVTLVRRGLTSPPAIHLTIGSTTDLLLGAIRVFATILWPFGLILVLSGLVANLTQVGWLWIPAAVVPRMRRARWISWDRVAEALGFVVRLTVLAGITWRFILVHDWQLQFLGLNETGMLLIQPFLLLGQLCVQLSLSVVALALVDYGYRYWRHEQRLKMTVEERRREQRDDAVDSRTKKRHSLLSRFGGSTASMTEISAVDSTSEIRPLPLPISKHDR